MKVFTRPFTGLIIALIFLCGTTVRGQSILNPNDSVITFSGRAPAQPPANTIGKWIRTVRMTWNTNNWKCYILNGNQFRLRFPNGYNPTANDGKVYPMLIFMHGEGEGGAVTDNEYQLFHGGQIFDTAVANGTWPGYVLCMQTQGGWGPAQMAAQQFIIDYMIKNNKLDPFHVVLNGLSGGGSGDWQLFQSKESYIAGLLPMSSVSINFDSPDSVSKWKFESIWSITGGKDGSPAPYTAQQVNNAMQAQGANYTYLEMLSQGHDTWDSTWSMQAFWPWMKAQYGSNPWTLFGRTWFCPGQTINVTVGVQSGYQAYQWRKNDTLISGATSNSINVTSVGTYDCRVERNNIWSDWSHTPVVIENPPQTVTPAITIPALMSNVVPAPDGNTGVTLQEPTGYATYLWQAVGSNKALSTTNTYYAPAGTYQAEVTQQYGCSTSFSSSYTVVNANGPNKPDPATGLVVTNLSQTSQRLNWNQNPNPNYQETAFEVYRGTQSGGPYKLIAITGPNAVADTVTGLKGGIKYYYIVRAVNNSGAAANSNEASGATSTDTQPPTTPGNLNVQASTQSTITLAWTKSTDNVGVTGYNVYVDGSLANVAPGTATTFTVTGLNYQQSYNFYVVATDAAGNLSPASNQVSGEPIISGMTYTYFALTGTTTTLPNYSTQRVTSTGALPNISLSPAGTRTTEFGLLFNGFLHVTTAGAYTFQVASSDGANVYLGPLNGTASPYTPTGTAFINNNGVHNPATTGTSASVNLSVGIYPIAVAYFKGVSGTPSLTLSWNVPGSGGYVAIPASAWVDQAVVNGQVPAQQTNLAATTLSYNKVSLSWTDNSGGTATTEIWRSTSATSGFAVVGNTAAGVTSFIDSTVSAATTYYYELKADNRYGESALTSAVNTTTQPLPAIPAVPGGFAGKALTYSSLSLSWSSVAGASTIVIDRSANNDQQYVQWAVLPGTATSFTDTGLYANSTYYYKIQAVNPGGSSAFTSEIPVVTLDNLPVINNLPAILQAKIGTTTVFNVSATQPGTSSLTLKASPLPAGVNFVDNGNRTGTLTVTPSALGGNYAGLYIVVTDAVGGADTATFALNVNNNTPPTLNAISNVTMNEGDSLTIPLSGANTASPSDTLVFSVSGAPARTVLTPGSNGTATLFLHPSFAAAGVYTVQVTLTDKANSLTATQSFTVTVKNKNPNTTIYSRFAYNDVSALGAPWNALVGATTNNLVDSNGNTTTVGLSFSPNTWWNTFNGGSSTGNNSGVYPDVVLQDYSWFGSIYGGPNSVSCTISGMDTTQLYDLTFFANSIYSGQGDNGWTTYTVGNQTVTLHVQNNTKNTVSLTSLKPASNGTVVFTMGLGQNNTQLGYINALVITKHFDDGSAPAGTSGLTAANSPGKVSLSWTDSAYNATGYQVYRSLTGTGNYTLLGTVAGNSANSYVDSNVTSNTGYTYEVEAVNTHGTSGFDSVSIVTQHRLPKITAIQNIVMKDTSSLTVNVTTTADPTSVLTLTATNLPPFATFTDNGNGTGSLTLSPSAGTTGMYSNVTITVEDQYDSTNSTSFSVAVTEPNVQSIYLSLSGGVVSPAPWNNLTTPPFQGTVLSNLKDDGGTPTGISATIVDGWYWFGITGYMAGNGQGTSPTQSTYPPTVVQNFIYDPSTNLRHIQFSGLNNAKQYNFVFFNSMWDGTNGLTWFNINGDSVSLQADWNVNHTIQINGIRPVNGVITVVAHKDAAAANAYLCSIVLQAYDTTAGTLIGPADLRATRVTQTTVSLQWQDRSAIETGYELWRATDASGTYSLLASLPKGTTTYMDTKLSKNTNYYYIVRAVSNGNYSNYSSVLAVTTYQDAVYVHPSYTSAGNGPTPPWNNLNNSGRIGASWSNWIDSTGGVTSIGMVQTGVFAGPNSLGDVTGNNSGVYPDPVLLQQYVLFPGNDGSFTISGLTLSKTYDFTFFGTENYEGGNQNTAYIVNGDTVFLNCLYNQQTIVTLYGVTPNAQGQVSLQMVCEGAAVAGWFNAMVINGYTPIARNAPTVPGVAGGLISPILTGASITAQFNNGTQTVSLDSVVTAYPNPFHTSFTLSVPVFNIGEKVMVTLYDMSGKLVYRKEFDDVQQGMNYLQVGEDGSIGGPGVYVGKVVFGSGRATQAIKLIKQ
ncbi:MAG TPA: fibronectin type III domain-containing protein [Puia sp.]|nr:fibronectin type III domain-containing protein [Puia sp.]